MRNSTECRKLACSGCRPERPWRMSVPVQARSIKMSDNGSGEMAKKWRTHKVTSCGRCVGTVRSPKI